MAVRIGYLVAGVAVGFAFGTAVMLTDAQELSAEVQEVAIEANLDPLKLAGASNTTGLPPRTYAIMAGHLAPPPDLALERLIDCLAWHESRNTPSATNRSSGAAGLLQFLPSTFRQTPQGRAGASPYDPVAAREAAKWMIRQGRLREWAVWRNCA